MQKDESEGKNALESAEDETQDSFNDMGHTGCLRKNALFQISYNVHFIDFVHENLILTS